MDECAVDRLSIRPPGRFSSVGTSNTRSRSLRFNKTPIHPYRSRRCAHLQVSSPESPSAACPRRFHYSLAAAVGEVCKRIRAATGLQRVVLSGGVFQNRLLTEELCSILEKDDFQVFTQRLVPPNDGGLALGQAILAGRSQLCA